MIQGSIRTWQELEAFAEELYVTLPKIPHNFAVGINVDEKRFDVMTKHYAVKAGIFDNKIFGTYGGFAVHLQGIRFEIWIKNI